MIACPRCGADSLELLRDAYVVYPIIGINADGTPSIGAQERVDEFDETRIVCQSCGEDISESELGNRSRGVV